MEGITALIDAFGIEKESDLLLHEICYCLGQMNHDEERTKAIEEFLEQVISGSHSSIVTHEAVEAYGNLHSESISKLLEKFKDIDDKLVGETCELALSLRKWEEETKVGETESLDFKALKYNSHDPAPPFNPENDENYKNVEWLKKILLDPNESIFERYRCMFTLREMGTDESCEALCQALTEENKPNCSALLKHEVGFVLGQMGKSFDKVCTPYLEKVVEDVTEAPVVRHECTLALGHVTCHTEVIEKYSEDPEPIVKESCIVAQDMVKNW